MMALGKYKRTLSKFAHKHISFLPALKYNYPQVVKNFFAPEDRWENVFPVILPQWDRTPRAGISEGIYVNATPENFRKHVVDALKVVAGKEDEHKIIFMKSWNEWGEGNYVEPDLRYGHGFLDVLQKVLT
jgi:hypothetical protein